MEEKKTTTISLSTFFLVLAIIAIVVMGVFIYKLYNDKAMEVQKSTELQAQVNSLNGTVSDLQGKINAISNTINTNNSSNVSNTASSNNDSNVNIDKIAKELFEKAAVKIYETEYSDYGEYEDANPVVDKEINGKTYRKKNVLYSEVEKKYSEIFGGEALNKILGRRFAEVDGYLYVKLGGASGSGVTNVKVSKISEANNEIEYTVKYNGVDVADNISDEKTCNMTIKLIDGNYRIISTDVVSFMK